MPRLLQNSSLDICPLRQITKSNELAQLHIMGQLHELMFHLGTIAPIRRKEYFIDPPTLS